MYYLMLSLLSCHCVLFRTGTFVAQWISTAFRTTETLSSSPPLVTGLSHGLLHQTTFPLDPEDRLAHKRVHDSVCTGSTRWTDFGCRSGVLTRLLLTTSECVFVCVCLRLSRRSEVIVTLKCLMCLCVSYIYPLMS